MNPPHSEFLSFNLHLYKGKMYGQNVRYSEEMEIKSLLSLYSN